MSNEHGSKFVNEAQINADLELIERLARLPWQRDVHNVEALIERLRVETIIQKHRGSLKRYHRAIIDRLEDVLEERYEKEDTDRNSTRKAVLGYIRSLWEGLDIKD